MFYEGEVAMKILNLIYQELIARASLWQSLVLIGTAGILVRQYYLQKNALKTEIFRKFAEREADVYKHYYDNNIDPEKTQNYEMWYFNKKRQYLKYDSFARYCWKLAENIFQENRWRKELMKRFAATFEIFYSHHRKWFENNCSFYETSGFANFVKTAEWRNYLDPEGADLFRWNSERYNYQNIVFSPLHGEMFSEFFRWIKKEIDLYRPKTIVDLGCGNGRLGIALAKECKDLEKIFLVDYADMMISYTKRRCEKEIEDKKLRKKIEIKRMKIQDMSEFETGKFDMVFSINSILPRRGNPKELKQMFMEISRITRIDGYFVALLPSFDTVIEFKNLKQCDLVEKYKKAGYKKYKKKVTKDIKKRFYIKGKLNERKKIYADDFRNPQRFFKDDEVVPLLKRHKFKLITQNERPKHFKYPWEFCKKFKVDGDYMYGYFPNKKSVKVYDLFIVAKRVVSEKDAKGRRPRSSEEERKMSGSERPA